MTGLLDPESVLRFRDVVAERLGLHFEEGRLDYLAGVLQKHVVGRGMGGVDACIERLRQPTTVHEEVRILADALTVAETYFFRYGDQLRAFVDKVLPELARRGRPLRILSAGCATGEEPYTVAALVAEQGVATGRPVEVEILAIDVNPAVLARARAARYTAWSLWEMEPARRARYFHTENGRDFKLDESIRRLVTFEERNLVDPDTTFWRPERFDVVFCRNVTMYFAPDVTSGVIGRIGRALTPGGFLFLGHAETLRGVSTQFHLRQTHGAFYYQRRDVLEPQVTLARGSGANGPPGREPPTALVPPADTWVEAIQRASEKIAALARGAERTQAEMSGGSPAAAVDTPSAPDLGLALDLLRRERFADAMAVLDALPPGLDADADATVLRAVLLTNTGRVADAEALCRRLLERDDLNAAAHHVLALCREHAGDLAAAEEHDQAALYLDPAFAMAHLHLGLMARRAQRLDAARRNLSQAHFLLSREDAARILLFGGGFSRDALMDLCRAELRACGGAP